MTKPEFLSDEAAESIAAEHPLEPDGSCEHPDWTPCEVHALLRDREARNALLRECIAGWDEVEGLAYISRSQRDRIRLALGEKPDDTDA